jgi:DNA-binding response OmpR family regulator
MVNKESQNRILIVEDDKTTAKFFEELLIDRYQVRSVNSGDTALSIVCEFTPHIILLDVNLGGMNGYQVCKEIRKNPKFDEVWILFLTCKGEIDDRLYGYRIGGDDYLVKPVDFEELNAKIKAFNRRSRIIENKPIINNNENESLLNHKAISFFSNADIMKLQYDISIDATQLVYVKAESPYCRLFCYDKEHGYCRIRVLLNDILVFLKSYNLIKIHRSYLVNPENIIDLKRKSVHDYNLIINSGTNKIMEIPVGRKYLPAVKLYVE